MRRPVGWSGFTLIELMVVMGMIVLMAGGSIAAYLRFNTNQQIANDSRRLVSELEKARTEAATLQYPSGCTGLTGVKVQSALVDNILIGVQTDFLCGSGNISRTIVPVLKSTIFGAAFEVLFVPGSGYLSTGTDLTIAIEDIRDSSITKVVTVGAYGDIY